ncbi:DUF6493 family protein [Stackebrandtia soli]|uniref:DUF7825 domain-containing protein n=1 Tax=Stackebrandtia soli TaxID=1892856 RepID=UPI0039EB503D
MEWRTIRKLIASANVDQLVEALRSLDDAGRAALAADIQGYSAQWSTELALNTSQTGGLWEFRRRRKAAALRRQSLGLWVAGAACLTEPADAASWLARDDINDDEKQIAPIVDALLARDRQWRVDLVGHLDPLLTQPRSPLASLTLELVRLTGMEPPRSTRFFAVWQAGCGGVDSDSATLAKGVGKAELRDTMITLWFAEPTLATMLTGAWPQALAILTGDGTLNRRLLIAEAVARLRHGGDEETLHGVLRLCRAMELTDEEIGVHVEDLVQLLVGSPTTVVEFAIDKLSRLDATVGVDDAIVLESSRIVLGRAEAELGEAQLTWIDAALERRREGSAALLACAARALSHDDESVRRTTVALLSTYSDRIDTEVDAAVTEYASELSPQLRALLPIREAADRDQARLSAVSAAAQATSVTPEALAPAITTVAELGELVSRVLDNARGTVGTGEWRPIEWRALEQVLAATVEFAHREPEQLAKELSSIIDGKRRGDSRTPQWKIVSAEENLRLLIAVAAGTVTDAELAPIADTGTWREAVKDVAGPHRVLLHRLRDITLALSRRTVPSLVSTPTAATGLIDAATLVRRLTEAAAAGWQPLESDLQLALLRLPAQPQPELAQTARGIDSLACARLAAALEAPAPAAGVTIPHARSGADDHATNDPQETIRGMLAGPPETGVDTSSEWAETWPSLWPTNPEAIAAWSLPHMMKLATGSGKGAAELTGLGDSRQPLGPNAHRVLALGLSASDAADRDLAVAALIRLTVDDAVDAEALGHVMAELVGEGVAKLTRVVPALTQASQGGAAAIVFGIVSHALPSLLPQPDEKPVNRLADLVGLGCDTAEETHPPYAIPELAAFAQRRASSKLVKEARRLHSLLEKASG